jgi:hypothetical protein
VERGRVALMMISAALFPEATSTRSILCDKPTYIDDAYVFEPRVVLDRPFRSSKFGSFDAGDCNGGNLPEPKRSSHMVGSHRDRGGRTECSRVAAWKQDSYCNRGSERLSRITSGTSSASWRITSSPFVVSNDVNAGPPNASV